MAVAHTENNICGGLDVTTGDLRQHWHMRITSSKCVLQQRHLLGYRTQTLTLTLELTLTLTLELTLTLTLFLTLTRTFFERKQKRHRNIGQQLNIVK